jgi:hypothetical protein
MVGYLIAYQRKNKRTLSAWNDHIAMKKKTGFVPEFKITPAIAQGLMRIETKKSKYRRP